MEYLPSFLFGFFLLVLGFVMLGAQRKAKRNFKESSLSRNERDYLRNRIRRRTQVAGLFIVMGVMIPIGEPELPFWENAPATIAIYWIIVLILAFWTILLAFADITATRLHSSIELTRLKQQQEDLERAAQQLREEHASSSRDKNA